MPSEAFEKIPSAVVAIPLDRRIPDFGNFVTKFKEEFLGGLTDATKVGVRFAEPPAIIPLLWIGEINTEADLGRVTKPMIGLLQLLYGTKAGFNGLEGYFSHYNNRERQEVGIRVTGSIGEIRDVSMRLGEGLSGKGAKPGLVSVRNGDRMIYIARVATLDSGLAINAFENKRSKLDMLLNSLTLAPDLVNRLVLYGYAKGDEGGKPVEIVSIEGYGKEPKVTQHEYTFVEKKIVVAPVGGEQSVAIEVKKEPNLQSAA